MGQATGAETGTEEKARELIGEYAERVDKLKKQYATVLASHTFAPVSFNGGNFETRPNRLLSVALRDLGDTPSATFARAIVGEASEYNPEQLLSGFGDADGVVMLVNNEETWQELQDNALFQQLPATAEGHVVRSDKQTHEGGPATAMHALDVIEQLLQTFQS